MPYVLIDPSGDLDYPCDWVDYLDEVGSPQDTITTSSWTITPQSGSPQEPELRDANIIGTITTIFVRGCVRGQVYQLTNHIVTGQGRTDERSVTLRCENR